MCTSLFFNVSNMISISSAFHAQFIVNAILFSSVCTLYIGNNFVDAEMSYLEKWNTSLIEKNLKNLV